MASSMIPCPASIEVKYQSVLYVSGSLLNTTQAALPITVVRPPAREAVVDHSGKFCTSRSVHMVENLRIYETIVAYLRIFSKFSL